VGDLGGGERATAERAVAGLGIRDHAPDQRSHDRARAPVGQRAVPAHPLAAAEEARAEHILRTPACDRVEQPREIGGVVLAVAIEVDGRRVAAVARVLEPGP